jgi:hypothetical protein
VSVPDPAPSTRRRWAQAYAIATGTVLWIATQAALGYVALGDAWTIGWSAERPPPPEVVAATRRLSALMIASAILLAAVPVLISVLARAGGLRRTSIAYAVLAVLLLVPAVLLVYNLP